MYELINKDTRTITGSNIREILIEINKENILNVNINHMKNQMKFSETPKDEEWSGESILLKN